MCKAWGDGKGSERSRLMGNNGAEREKRATSCKQRSLNSSTETHFNPQHSLCKDLLLLQCQTELYTAQVESDEITTQSNKAFERRPNEI